MTGSGILKTFLIKIHDKYGLAIPDFEDLIDIGSVDECIALLVGHHQISARLHVAELLLACKEVNVGPEFITEVYLEPVEVTLIDFSTLEFHKRNRPFSYSDLEYGFLSFKKLFQLPALRRLPDNPIDFKIVIDYVSKLIIDGDDANLSIFIDRIEAQSLGYGIFIGRTAITPNLLSAYSYVYYKLLLSGEKIKIDNVLDYNLPHGAMTNYNHAISYQQYFEVFDIVSELNNAGDIITRFLKLYHIIEYLMYRVELVNLERKARINRSFIRDFHSLTGQKNSETDILKRNFVKVFAVQINGNTFNLGALQADQCRFLKDNWHIPFDSATNTVDMTTPKNVVMLIYGIRNSIVHNKESEFHLTTSNPDDFAIIIPIIKTFITKLERTILDAVSANVPELRYETPHIQLY